MECPGPRSAAPWVGRNEVDQDDANLKNIWALSELGVVRMDLIADERPAMVHWLGTTEEARTWVAPSLAGKKQAP